MTTQEQLVKPTLRLLEEADHPGYVRQACKIMGRTVAKGITGTGLRHSTLLSDDYGSARLSVPPMLDSTNSRRSQESCPCLVDHIPP